MRKMRIFRGVAAIACVFAMTSIATADTLNFDFDTTGNGAVFPMNSGASIPYEIFLSIDDGGDGRSSQGLQGYELTIQTDTGITQPNPSHALTGTGSAYMYTAADPSFTGTNKVSYVNGYGLNFLNSTGTQTGDDIVGAGAFGGLEYRSDVFNSGQDRPSLQAGIGYGTPTSEGFPNLNSPASSWYGGTVRSAWYLLAGSISVPDAPGVYTVSILPTAANTITNQTDLNNNDLDGYIQSELGSTTGGSFSFTVTPEPATMSVLLLAGAGLVIRRRK